ncbi:type IV secretion system protein [Luteibacter aegosomatis]|uniref:virB8 family protein n=1 Tax=Luteibacter aegosomatis TaxID=2911537 RepID=UPI001FF8FDA1|nr:type IV secretion system protein [Luteibacter aegosomatis]UPG84667.1 type IV secretion system protein [Luteibacter aegosomatis]
MLKKKESPKIDEAVSRSVNFEVSIADLAKRSERRAWIVAMCSLFVSLCLIGGYFYILPLKEKVPYLIMADAYTGTSSLSQLTDDVLNRQLTARDAINRSNITHFIMAREAYDYDMILLRDWDTVMTMSSQKLATEYMALNSSRNPAAPFKTYGRDRAIRVKILSIVMIPSETPGAPPIGATVRFQRSVYNKTTGTSTPLDNKIATMSFVYKPNLRMDDRYRVENPLGFQVTGYRVDNDYADSPPPEIPVDPAAAQPGVAPAAASSAGALPNGTDAASTITGQPQAPAAIQPTAQPTVQPSAAAPAATGQGGSVNGVRR